MSQQDKQGRPQGSQQGGYEAGRRQAQGGHGEDYERSAAGSNYGDWSGSRSAQDERYRGGYGGQESGREDYHGGGHERQESREPGNYGRQDYGNSGRFGGGEGQYGMRRDMGSMHRQDDMAWGRGEQGGSRHESEFDPDYLQWRNEQMRSLDEDYRSWRRDRFKKFSDEFSTWRGQRAGRSQPGAGESSGAGSSGSSGAEAAGSSATPAGKGSN